ncbi:helix-turn-helix domain-containing protein [Vibrio europaeus]|uniref:Helix-turn-helix domain-containing protein n=1 Tax=Vibrio europaeus TaxID=300876 RepID=A0A178J5N4_9VIBR|nr:sugar diacid recognition domain-containing protein [Vibrio europaeus]MDC5705725.1 helix-turn-helix domain-containing protein [Vibrio europaeus]MDC5711004.1 helix-turn-helix domain-containing protein [Vibrio europaeus]MDC5716094.1 helix-turn-helix domain-containing protein [Vibrio europaeus]MDC5720253.1 helix-turn-helix domain-containing protein [Vibrio europaeus]MDC5723858.1 helix-turn-helix domain-containing protein [Vibrio europaeus]
MQLNTLIARQIVERATKIIQFPVNVMDENGIIIGSSDPARLHRTHEGALLAIHDNRTVEINHTVASTLIGVKEGINLPILHQDSVIGVVGISGQPEEVRRYGELVKMTAELIVEQADLMAQIQWNKRHREELLLQLIQGSTLNETQLLSIAERLDLDLAQPRVAATVKVIPKQGQPLTLEQLQKLVHLLEYPERDNIVGIVSVSQNEVVVLKPVTLVDNTWSKAEEKKRVKRLLKRIAQEADFTVKIAMGEYFPGLTGLSRSYETAKATLVCSDESKDAILFYQEHKLSVLIDNLKQDEWRRNQISHPIEILQQHDSKDVLVKTLKEFFAQDCDLAQTCAALHIHRNTLRYRIEKIEEVTGLKINKLDHKVQLYLALKCV